MNASLNEKLRSVKWGEYRLGDLFEIENTLSFNADRLVGGIEYDYVTRTSLNYGVLQRTGFVNKENINPAGTWSLGLLQMDFFYRNKPWYAGQFVRRIVPKIDIPENALMFFQTLLNMQKPILLQVLVRHVDETFRKIKIFLPQRHDGKIDFDFMESFVAELEAERVAELEAERVAELSAYLKVSGLDNYELSSEEKKVINEYEDIKFAEYDILKIFDVKNTHNILSDDIVDGSGTIPYLCAGAENNSISSYISYKNEYLEKGNCIFIGGKTFIVTYQERDFFSNDSHNLALYVKEINANKLQQLYITTCVKKSLSHKYSWGNSVSKAKIKTDKISLPTKDGKPDYKTMELLISAIQKLVIKDVVQFTNRKLDTYKNIVSKSSFRYQIGEQRSMIAASADKPCLDY